MGQYNKSDFIMPLKKSEYYSNIRMASRHKNIVQTGLRNKF